MLNIYKFKLNNNDSSKHSEENKYNFRKGDNNYFSPINAEWSDNIYKFNQNDIKLLPTKHNLILKLIKSYFNMSMIKLDRKIRRIKKLREKRPIWKILSSSKRLFISKPKINHTNDKITINIFVYNRQKNIIINKYNKLKTELINKLFINKNNSLNRFFKQKLTILNSELSIINNYINKNKAIVNLKKIIFFKNIFRKLDKLMYLRKIYFLNDFKFKSTYMLPLIKLIEKIYDKKVNINIISLKYYYLNSDILTQVLAYKIKKRKDRGKANKFLNSAIKKIKTSKVNINSMAPETDKNIHNKKFLKQSLQYLPNNRLNNFSYKNYLVNKKNYYNNFYKDLQNDLLNSIKNKNINGIRLEVAGRITKRLTAQRAGYKYNYVGTLKNLDSSYRRLSFPILKGNTKFNVQHTVLKSKTLMGSFGLKGWISSK